MKVYKNVTQTNNEVLDLRKIEFQYIWPTTHRQKIQNPRVIGQTIADQVQELRDATVPNVRMILPFGWGRAITAVLFFMVFAVVGTMSVLKEIPLLFSAPVALFSLYIGAYLFSRFPDRRIKDG